MSRLYTVLNALLLVGGIVALVLGAWPLGLVLVVLGGLGLSLEIRARRPSVYVALADGPDAKMEQTLAKASSQVTNAHGGANSSMFLGNGGF